MSSTEEYIVRIRKLSERGHLLSLWDHIQQGLTVEKGWEPGMAFQYLVLRAFELEGAEVTWPYKVQLMDEDVEQIDGAIYAGGLACLVESKDHGAKLSIDAVAKLRNQLMRRPAGTIGLLFSRSGFTEPSVLLAQFLAPQAVLLWDGPEFGYAIGKAGLLEGLRRKYRYAVEHAFSYYNILPQEETIQ